ncbi:MAG: hypothetical protein FWG50_06925, partial [Kiritimatiellaeota bacterium]|nr:hypothetical protein [Kiritimatiellota bacterium]
MNCKHLFFTLLCVGLSIMLNANTEDICDVLRKELKTFKGSGDNPIDVLFFDINHDGLPDALVSERVDKSAGGCHGNLWYLYRFENGEWQYMFKEDGDPDSYNSVSARVDGFYSLTEEGQKPKLFLVYEFYARNYPTADTEVHQNGYEIAIDNEGYLKAIPVPELTTNYFPRYDEELDAVWMATTEMQDKLVPLAIETFDPREAQKPDEKKQAVADDSEGRAAANHKGELGM